MTTGSEHITWYSNAAHSDWSYHEQNIFDTFDLFLTCALRTTNLRRSITIRGRLSRSTLYQCELNVFNVFNKCG